MDMRRLKNKIKREDALGKLKLNIEHSSSRTVFGDDGGFFYNLIVNFENIISFECPDMYFKVDDGIVAIEHFEFDSYRKSNSKGSMGRRDVVEADKNAITERRNMGSSYITQNMQTEMSIDDYTSNLLCGFERHYKRIPEYSSNISLEFPNAGEIKICFYIEDSTPLGNRFVSKNGNFPLHPLLIKEFADTVMESNDLDYLIYSLKDTYFTRLYFSQNDMRNHEIFSEFYDNQKHIFLDYTYEHISSFYSLADDA